MSWIKTKVVANDGTSAEILDKMKCSNCLDIVVMRDTQVFDYQNHLHHHS